MIKKRLLLFILVVSTLFIGCGTYPVSTEEDMLNELQARLDELHQDNERLYRKLELLQDNRPDLTESESNNEKSEVQSEIENDTEVTIENETEVTIENDTYYETSIISSPDSKNVVGQCGDNLMWEYNEGHLRIYGYGEMYDYTADLGPWLSGVKYIKSVTVEEGCTAIYGAFRRCENLTSVELPSSLRVIGDSSFSYCAFENINIPYGVVYIGEAAFKGCTSLRSIQIPDSVTSVGMSAFSGCTALEYAYIPNQINIISTEMFTGCNNLSNVTIPLGVTTIGSDAFRDCSSISSIIIPEGVTKIGAHAYDGCGKINYISLPSTLTDIGSDAFAGCKWMDTIVYKGEQYRYFDHLLEALEANNVRGTEGALSKY